MDEANHGRAEEKPREECFTPQPDTQPDREAQPVDAEQPPRLPFAVVGVGASAGGLEAFGEFLKSMPPDSGMAFVFILHLPPDHHSLVAEVMSRHTKMRVMEAGDGMVVEPNHVYIIRPAHVLTIKEGLLHLGPRLDGPRAANRPVDDFFKSLAQEQRERAIAIIMSGMGSNGAAGAQAIKAVGGLCIAQDPESAQFPSMPRHLIDAGYADFIVRPAEMPEVLLQYATHPYATGGREEDADTILQREKQYLREILAVLRTGIKHDFSGYKKPTVLRRIQRRMGLARITSLSNYAKLLRQTPAEVSALADDLLIHVTGFFRDPEAWEALRERVIVPLVAARENDSSIRCWVTACSSGEEAYSLAILLVEEIERTGRNLDIKVFATDMADRTLGNARSGIYPGGIEADIAPERLARFFERDDATYRVRQDLREHVIFAPQNILQDPPFSRLDIASCRNLLIYLEPEVQKRVLSLLHFGLREGGALFLGTSETLGGTEELFEPLDKKSRIFRRVGLTRHGMVDFPLPHALRSARVPSVHGGGSDEPPAEPSRQAGFRASFAQLTQHTLLEHHLPAAVLVDRDHRILYYQGDTQPFLGQSSGEPTRDVIAMARAGVRGAVHVTLHRAGAQNGTVTTKEGWVETAPGRRSRVHVTVSPVADRTTGEYFVVSFDLRDDSATADPAATSSQSDENMAADILRMRDELQSTVEELQSSNEELKASHEEVVSINEELQSSNEELETSKEEMQSLNEELATVNAQLRAKMEEHQAASNDLSSLLTSTDIAVLFLDTHFRIRRFTPPTRELMDLISSDVDRPLSDMARKFDDPALLADAETVLARLVPAEREVKAEGGRWFLRRITPYRTADNRIDGVVITFVDITERRRAEEGLRESEERLRLALFAARMGTWVWEVGGDRHTRDENLNRLLGLNPVKTTLPIEEFFTHIHPDDVPAVRAAFDLSVRQGRPLNAEFRVQWPDGTIRWLQDQGEVFTKESAPYMAGACIDVTDRRRADAALRESEERLRLLVEGARDFAMLLLDKAGLIAAWNIGAERLLGFTASEAIGQHVAIIFTPEDDAAGAPARELAQAAALGRATDERWHRRKDGSRFWGSGVMTALHNEDGTIRGFVKILRDESVGKQAEEAKKAALAVSELANQTKDEFLATLSHELRTPLSAILLWSKLLLSESDPNSLAEGLAAIRNSAEAQKLLIEDLLDTARITSGQLRLQMRPTDLILMVESAVEFVAPAAEAKEVKLLVDLDPHVDTVRADPDRMRQIFANLITNAVKFTPSGGTVNVTMRRHGDDVEMKVIDTGRGITAEFLPHVFEAFRQADSTTTRQHGGLGLGLAICKRLVEQHGGTITAHSDGPGRGSTFMVLLPLPPFHGGDNGGPPLPGEQEDAVSIAGVHVLLVEDDAKTRAGLARVLKQAGASVSIADSAATGVKSYLSSRPNVIISDIGLPDEDGYSLIQKIRALEAKAGSDRVPAVALTAFVSAQNKKDALAAGFNQHMGKPVEPQQLLSAIKEIARQKNPQHRK